ncbi:hypothetical protein ACFE04_002296 [Oxalis oulophora]
MLDDRDIFKGIQNIRLWSNSFIVGIRTTVRETCCYKMRGDLGLFVGPFGGCVTGVGLDAWRGGRATKKLTEVDAKDAFAKLGPKWHEFGMGGSLPGGEFHVLIVQRACEDCVVTDVYVQVVCGGIFGGLPDHLCCVP